MMKPTTSHCLCPTCRGPVFEQRREISSGERVGFFFADIPFWILFGICVAIGMWQVLAGVLAFAVALVIFYRWHRERSSFRCYTCDGTFRYPELLPEQRQDA